MNLGGKEDLDALLKSWPAPLPKGMSAGEEERGWEERADAIVRAAGAARSDAAKAKAESLFEAPVLSPEPGEEAAVTAAGEKKMSQEEKESGDSASTKAPTVTPMPSERKRPSLKEIAARASQSGARLSSPGAPPPSSAAPASRQSTPPPPSVSRPVEAGKDDSGVINLQVVHSSATAAQVAAAEKAKPAQAGLFEDDKHEEKAEKPAAKAAVAAAASDAGGAKVVPLPQKKSNAGLIGGVAIAAIGIAAAFAIMSKSSVQPPPAAPVMAEKAPPAQTAAPEKPAPAPTQAPVATAEPAATATAEPEKVAEAPKSAVPGPMPTGAGAATAATGAPTADKVAKSTGGSGKPGDLQSEMIKAVGKDGQPKADQSVAMEPAAGGPKNQNIPEQPSQGAVAAAFNPVMGSAKACVAGADDVSRASVTFSSAGNVTSVSVSGWAAANGKSGCVQAALKGAKVNPFSKPSFTVGVPIRP